MNQIQVVNYIPRLYRYLEKQYIDLFFDKKIKKELYDSKVLKVAEETKNIEKENLIVSQKAYKIAVTALIVVIVSILFLLIALFK